MKFRQGWISEFDSKGSLVFDEVIVPLVDIYLADGQVWFVGRTTGPVPAVHTTTYTIHDREGGIVVRVVNADVHWDDVETHSTLAVVVPLAIRFGTAAGKKGPRVFAPRH